MSGKGSNRRREDAAKVEANWPTEWNARERANPCEPARTDERRITVELIDGPNEMRQRLDRRAAILSGEGLGKFGHG